MESIVNKEVAEAEFERFATIWDIFHSVAQMTPEDRLSFEQQKLRIINEIIVGAVTVDEEGALIYVLKYPFGELKEIKMSIPTGAAHMAMDLYKEGQNMHKMFAFMGSCSKKPPVVFSNMDGRDVKLPLAVASLFLGS